MRDPPRAELDRFAEALIERQAGIVEPNLHLVVRRRLGDHELEAASIKLCVPLAQLYPDVLPEGLDVAAQP